MSPRENAALKAVRLLGQGRVVLLRVDDRSVDAVVRGDAGEFYRLPPSGSWLWLCPAVSTACSHTRAVMLVTPFGIRGDGWRPAMEITDTWRDAPVEDWKRSGEPLPNGIEKRRLAAL